MKTFKHFTFMEEGVNLLDKSYYVGNPIKVTANLNKFIGDAGYKEGDTFQFISKTQVSIDYDKSTELQRFPEDLASSLVGKKFTRLSYKTTKKKESGDHYWRDWQQVAPENHFEELRKEFMEAVTHRNPDTDEPQPYVKDFLDPEQDVDDALEGPWDDEITATETPIDGAVPKAPVMPNL